MVTAAANAGKSFALAYFNDVPFDQTLLIDGTGFWAKNSAYMNVTIENCRHTSSLVSITTTFQVTGVFRRGSVISIQGGSYSLLVPSSTNTVSYTHLRAHETPEHLVCRLLLEKKKKIKYIVRTELSSF
eukprot:TRINITY_DN44295_c0_g1_i1.p1 TRINITY_DN44295_c0_g1~~TRINITY_DN44295_c0_g1_i1.p1  ORF type:complete len:129 (+),score=15.12 TRINITY_DN44295_c0_g1_i1:196-582(+)